MDHVNFEFSAGERSTGSTEDGEWLWRTSTKGQERGHGSGEVIITKKHFIPEKFLHVATYEGRLNSRRVRVWAMSYLRARAACSCTCYSQIIRARLCL